jgi:hypothetical protein
MFQKDNADTVNPLTSVQQVFCRFWEDNHRNFSLGIDCTGAIHAWQK